jgi:hypothetical protein
MGRETEAVSAYRASGGGSCGADDTAVTPLGALLVRSAVENARLRQVEAMLARLEASVRRRGAMSATRAEVM